MYVTEVKTDANVGDEILKVSAFDSDLEKCFDKDYCPCGRVKYSIEKGNEEGLLHIDPDTGSLILTSKLYSQFDSISLSIQASNQAGLETVEMQSSQAMATVIITSIQNHEAGRHRRSLHHRARRATTVSNHLLLKSPKLVS